MADFLLILLFFLTIARIVTMKLSSMKLDDHTAPLFTAAWSLAGLGAAAPLFGHLWAEGWRAFMAAPALLALSIAKGLLFYAYIIIGQRLVRVSLSSRQYVAPMSVGLIAVTNYFLGEVLTWQQWFSALGLCALAAGFFFRGHMSELQKGQRVAYAELVFLSVAMSAIDHSVVAAVNWYAHLVTGGVILLIIGAWINRKTPAAFRDALFHPSAAAAGAAFSVTELVKFGQMVTFNPVTAVVTVQALTQPAILALSALAWKERTVREQLLWGACALALVALPLLFG